MYLILILCIDGWAVLPSILSPLWHGMFSSGYFHSVNMLFTWKCCLSRHHQSHGKIGPPACVRYQAARGEWGAAPLILYKHEFWICIFRYFSCSYWLNTYLLALDFRIFTAPQSNCRVMWPVAQLIWIQVAQSAAYATVTGASLSINREPVKNYQADFLH